VEEAAKTVLVAGDVIVDHHIYQGDRDSPASTGRRGTITRRTPGGAALLFDMLAAVSRQVAGPDQAGQPRSGFSPVLGLERARLTSLPASLHGYGVWRPYPIDKGRNEEVWRLETALGYGRPADAPPLPIDPDALKQRADIVVLDDGGLGFRVGDANDAWPLCLRKTNARKPEWIVLKTAGPITNSDLWRAVSCDRLAGRTILLVSIDDIRKEEVRVTCGISWERTALDLAYELSHNPALSPLRKCCHCIVSFGSEGALHVSKGKGGAPAYRLIFDPGHMEQDWSRAEGIEGRVFGYMSCLTAAVTSHLAMYDPDDSHDCVEEGIVAGLSAMRVLHCGGHGKIEAEKPGVQFTEVAGEILSPVARFASVPVPTPARKGRSVSHSWTIMGGEQGSSDLPRKPLFGIAHRVATLGPSSLINIPYQEFGKLFVVDRSEIESLCNMRQLIQDYDAHDKGKKPLSVATFGPPGAGKSFGVEQIAKAVLGDKVPILEFNLSQFVDTDDLIGALHQVRDKVLKGRMPVVLWDEFDSREYEWLQYLLAPMQDGAFREGQIVHAIGKCVFVFAGGTSYDFENFGPPPEDKEASRAFALSKGPDFKSRLAGYLNVLGSNRRQIYDREANAWVDDETDICFPVRRALLLRIFLGQADGQRLCLDSGVQSGFLELGRYKHGTRSMRKVVEQMVTRGLHGELRRSDLPPAEIMSMHADYEEFMTIADRDLEFKALAGKLAPAVHEYYRDLYPSPPTDMPFDELPPNYKADNVAAAMRIPMVLALADLHVVLKSPKSRDTSASIKDRIKANLDLLAEAEHDGWMAYKLANGWRYGPQRDDEQRIHHLLLPFAALPEREKDKDRNAVTNYPEIVKIVDYKITTVPKKKG